MIFRKAEPDDIPQIIEAVSVMVSGTAFSPPTKEKMLRFISGDAYHQGVWLDGRLIAFMCGQLSETFLNSDINAYDKGLFVLPEYRGTRLPVRLIRNFEQWACSRGAKQIWLSQSVGNKRESTLKFFERLGYKCQGFTTYKQL